MRDQIDAELWNRHGHQLTSDLRDTFANFAHSFARLFTLRRRPSGRPRSGPGLA
ncbi:MAG TPA: hypothetical protein VEZ70_07965 [Allosphingosinicella sp.]|nr:hypothetical protein [Allosphingosinicella sp.]